jgi:hypothetical protein
MGIIGQISMKHERKKRFKAVRALPCLLIAWLIVGCAVPTMRQRVTAPPPDSLTPRSESLKWWAIRFRMEPSDDQPHWEKDLLLAHRIIAPVLEGYRQDIELWRFHRRSADDATGHQFSFLYYASASASDRIKGRIMDDPLLQQLRATHVIKKVLTEEIDRDGSSAVGDTSDSHWSVVMQDNWPYYIMGVSRMWLGMIDQVSRKIGVADRPTVEQLLDHYGKVNTQITHIWQQEGYHALLHHLNAIYGYVPMIYWEKRWKSF